MIFDGLWVILKNFIYFRSLSRFSRSDSPLHIRINFTPTVPHCSLATLIGLCIRVKTQNYFGRQHKLDIFVSKGSHKTEEDVNKQINDKERVAAAMENENLKKLVDQCIEDQDC